RRLVDRCTCDDHRGSPEARAGGLRAVRGLSGRCQGPVARSGDRRPRRFRIVRWRRHLATPTSIKAGLAPRTSESATRLCGKGANICSPQYNSWDMTTSNKIVVSGAREHNLKDISLELPRDALV